MRAIYDLTIQWLSSPYLAIKSVCKMFFLAHSDSMVTVPLHLTPRWFVT